MKELPIQIAVFIRISVLIIGVKLNTLFGFGFQKGKAERNYTGAV
jgi:hypothetical protein